MLFSFHRAAAPRSNKSREIFHLTTAPFVYYYTYVYYFHNGQLSPPLLYNSHVNHEWGFYRVSNNNRIKEGRQMENNTIKTDRRVIKTKRAIHKAMTQLMTEKDINDISVTEIADLADINRKTFYNYYTGVYQLVDEIEDEIVGNFAELIKSIDFEAALADPSIIFDKLYATISDHFEFVDALFSSERNFSLSNKVLNTLIEMTSDAAVEHFRSDPEKTQIITRFIFAGEIATYQAWYHSGMKLPIKELSNTIEALCTKGCAGILAE